MNKKQIEEVARGAIRSIEADPPASVKSLPTVIETAMHNADVPYTERRLVAMQIANFAESLEPTCAGRAKELMSKIAGYALDVHDRWARLSWYSFTRGPRNATRAELDQLAREGRQFEALAEVVKGGVESLTGGLVNVARSLPALPETRVTVMPSTAPTVQVQVDSEIVLKASELKAIVEEVAKPETATGKKKLPARLGPQEEAKAE